MTRPAIVTAIALALPPGVGAQQPAATSPAAKANPITESFEGFGHFGWLMTAFDSIPANRYDFNPTPAQQSVGYIAQHLEDANYGLCARFSGLTRQSARRLTGR